MFWFIFAISSAFFHALHFAFVKKFLKGVNLYVLAAGSFFITAVILFLASMIKGVPEIGSQFYLAVLATTLVNLIATVFNFKALKLADLSLTIPMLSFTPVFLILTSFVLLGELPSFLGGVGIVLVVVGSYILNLKENGKNFWEPFRELFKNKGVLFMLLVAFLYSISTNFDKLVVLNSDPIFGVSIVYFLLSFSFFVVSKAKNYDLKIITEKNLSKFFFVALATALAALTMNIAFTSQIVPYVISIKRTSVLFSVILGWLFFKERHISKRLLGALIMLLGAVIILLF